VTLHPGEGRGLQSLNMPEPDGFSTAGSVTAATDEFVRV